MKNVLEKQENLDLRQVRSSMILDVEDGKVKGVLTKNGAYFNAKAVIISNRNLFKRKNYNWRSIVIVEDLVDLFPANELSKSLIELGITLRRFKTGTPARINRRSVDFSKMEEQTGDEEIVPFSFISEDIR